MATMEQQFAEAREKALKSSEDYVSSQFADQETVAFRFDGFSFWNKSSGAEELWGYLHEQNLHTDPWNRAIWILDKEQAKTIANLVEEWNAHWEYDIAQKSDLPEDEDPMMYYNAYHISFSPANGREHTMLHPAVKSGEG